MAASRTPRERWVEEGTKALAAGGPDAVRVEPLAESIGVTKGGFYWHFDGRKALLDEILDLWEHRSVDDVIERVDAGGGDARARLHRLFGLAGDRRDVLEVDLAVRDWARRDKRVAARLRRADDRRMAYMRELFAGVRGQDESSDDVEAAAMLAFSLWIGNHFIAARHGERSRAEVVGRALKRLETWS